MKNLPHLPSHLLEALVVAGESTNLIEAAKKLGITQPTLSRQLRELERAFPFPIFDYSGRNKVLTRYGRALHQALAGRFGGIPNLISQVTAHFSDPQNTVLRISGRREVLHPFVPHLKFAGTLKITYLGGQALIDSLISKHTDICVSQRLPDSSHVVARPLFKRGFVLAIPKNMTRTKPVLSSSAALAKVLTGGPCVAFSEDLHSVADLLEHLEIIPKKLNISRICADWTSLREMTENGLGWAVLPATSDISEKACWIVGIPPTIIESVQFYIMYLKELGTIPWFQSFIRAWPPC